MVVDENDNGERDLELPTFAPLPKVPVSTWIHRVELELKGAVESVRGKWSDKALYFSLGNKSMENASKGYGPGDVRTEEDLDVLEEGTLLMKLDKSTAEWRVNMRRMMPGETHADFTVGLRDVVGRNNKLVKQRPKPKALEEVVEKATEIDDQMDNATAPSRYFVPVDGTIGQTSVIPGVSGTGLDARMTEFVGEGIVGSNSKQAVALFTNPQGVYNAYSGTWDPPPGYVWNGKYWYELRKTTRKAASISYIGGTTETKSPATKYKLRLGRAVLSDEELVE
ncbi:LOW QUALITY PROTEIN: Hypothetical protein PHPALM_20615 [Phytophthora palmivora]|uniref:Uncharacterized protein n=1 Tax=Phytophthora palmivora TaxID=4796 RepID=A0A2P4XEF4_9STRA|nr:LOW QUALITY PROTEIN: Hypothetical protein PHPALM_20615 [Phytophthora palmivora]